MSGEQGRKVSFRDRFKESFDRLGKGEGFRLDRPADKTVKTEQVHRQYTPERPAFHTRYPSAESFQHRGNLAAALPLRPYTFVQRKFPVLRPLLLQPNPKTGSKVLPEIRTHQAPLAALISSRRENPTCPYGQVNSVSRRRKEYHSSSVSALM